MVFHRSRAYELLLILSGVELLFIPQCSP